MEGSGHLQAPAALSPENEPPLPSGIEAGWIAEPNWTLKIKVSDPAGNRIPLPHDIKTLRSCDGRNILARRTVNSGSKRNIFRKCSHLSETALLRPSL